MVFCSGVLLAFFRHAAFVVAGGCYDGAVMSPVGAARRGYMLCLSAALVWSMTSIGIRYLLEQYHVPTLTIAFWRDILIALTCLGVSFALHRDELRVSRAALRGFVVIGVVSIGWYHALYVQSVALNGAAVATVLIYLYPAFVTIGARFLFSEPFRGARIAALVLALFGCVLLVRAYDPAVFRVSWVGALVGVGTAATHAGYVLFSQRSVQSYSVWTSLGFTMFFGALTLLVMALVSAPWQALVLGTTPMPWLIIVVLALGPTLGGYMLFTASLRYIAGPIASLLSILEAPASTVLAVVLLGERLVGLQVVGLGLIMVAVVLPQLFSYRRARRVPGA